MRIGPHYLNHNQHSIVIYYESILDTESKPADTRTEAQMTVMGRQLEHLHTQYPKELIIGHNVFASIKACPCFDATKEYRDLQLA